MNGKCRRVWQRYLGKAKDIAKRGKNKQGRGNLSQVNYALFCRADGQIPLYWETYEGNRNDARPFPRRFSPDSRNCRQAVRNDLAPPLSQFTGEIFHRCRPSESI